MRHWFKTFGKWTLRVVLVLVLLIALDITALTFPFPLFAHQDTFNEFTIILQSPHSRRI